MSDITLSLSLLPVGPRDAYALTEGATWRFALQVSIGFTGEPTANELDAWADAVLPWIALDTNPGDTLNLDWAMFTNHHLQEAGTAAAVTEGKLQPTSANGTSKPSPRELLAANMRERWRKFVRDPEPPRLFTQTATMTAAVTSLEKVFVPSVMQITGGALPPIASGDLQFTWYFQIVLSAGFVEAAGAGNAPILAAWPRRLKDVRGPVLEFHYDPTNPPGDDDFGGEGILSVRCQIAQHDPVRAVRILPLSISRLLNTPEPALKTYWLPTSDSRLDSLAEIGQVVARGMKAEARIAFLTPESVVSAEVPRSQEPDALGDARLLLDVARKVFSGPKPPKTEEEQVEEEKREAEAVKGLIAKAMTGPAAALMDNLRAALVEDAVAWWTTDAIVNQINTRAIADRVIDPAAPWPVTGVDARALFGALGAFVLPTTTDVRPLLPGAGLDVLLGTAARRLRHERAAEMIDPATETAADDTGNDSDHAQIAELGVLARRAATFEALTEMPWSLATAGLAAIDVDGELRKPGRYWGSEIDPQAGVTDESVPYDRHPFVRGIKSAFLNGVAHTDITYRGLPLAVSTVGSALHGVNGEQTSTSAPLPDIEELLPINYQPVGPVFNAKLTSHQRCRVPPLRYGDWYQFAGFVIDRAGGIPLELARHGLAPLSCNLDFARLAPNAIPLLNDSDPAKGTFKAMQHLRAVPVGEINVRPSTLTTAGIKPEWPALPEGVVLRAREWLSARVQGTDSVPALLLRKGPEFADGQELAETRFRVSPPQLDEMTLKDWLMPRPVPPANPGELPEAEKALAILNEALANIHRDRAALKGIDWANPRDVLPPDPAVARIGLRGTFVDEKGVATEIETFLDGASTSELRVTLGSVIGMQGRDVTIAPGTFTVLELVPLVRTRDFARFQPLATSKLIEEDTWSEDLDSGQVETYVAFQPTRLIVEAASAKLPDARQLYEALTLGELPSGAIEVALAATAQGAPLDGLVFVDRFELHRERWVWRNRPVTVGKGAGPQSALPVELADPDRRDVALPVLAFDALAQLDRGLADRGRIGGRVPRALDGAPLPVPRLLVDDRDAVAHADYLRFGCALLSRYAGILRPEHQRIDGVGTHAANEAIALEPVRRVKRITSRFRGDVTRLKAPKVLAILPLTQGVPAPEGVQVSPDATPFLIVLDEILFREYGAGERLSLEVVLETKEIGESDEGARPFRVGPLPDHYVTAHLKKPPFVDLRLYKPSTDAAQEKIDNRQVWPLFGPFGYSLDRSGNESLANATAFVAFRPKEIRAHYAAFVRLRRQLFAVDGAPLTTGEPPRRSKARQARPTHSTRSPTRVICSAAALRQRCASRPAPRRIRIRA